MGVTEKRSGGEEGTCVQWAAVYSKTSASVCGANSTKELALTWKVGRGTRERERQKRGTGYSSMQVRSRTRPQRHGREEEGAGQSVTSVRDPREAHLLKLWSRSKRLGRLRVAEIARVL